MTVLYATMGDNKQTRSVILRNGPNPTSTPLDLTNATAVVMNASGLATSPKTCTFLTDATGSVSVSLVTADLAKAGNFQIEWQVTFADGTVTTVPSPGTDTLVVRQQVA